MTPRVWGKRLSSFFMACYRAPDFPTKLRWLGYWRKWAGYPRLTVPYAKDGWITLDERDHLQTEIFLKDSYEPEVWDALAEYATVDEIVWDVGAHIGCISIPAMLDTRVKEVHAFEPNPVQTDLLALNLSLNRGRCIIHPIALSDREEIRELYRWPIEKTPPNTGRSSFAFEISSDVIGVHCATADALAFQKGVPIPTLMKVDVEGWEWHVFQGAQKLLKDAPPKAIVFETANDESGRVLNGELISYLERFGYRVQMIQRPNGAVIGMQNYLATHRTR